MVVMVNNHRHKYFWKLFSTSYDKSISSTRYYFRCDGHDFMTFGWKNRQVKENHIEIFVKFEKFIVRAKYTWVAVFLFICVKIVVNVTTRCFGIWWTFRQGSPYFFVICTKWTSSYHMLEGHHHTYINMDLKGAYKRKQEF